MCEWAGIPAGSTQNLGKWEVGKCLAEEVTLPYTSSVTSRLQWFTHQLPKCAQSLTQDDAKWKSTPWCRGVGATMDLLNLEFSFYWGPCPGTMNQERNWKRELIWLEPLRRFSARGRGLSLPWKQKFRFFEARSHLESAVMLSWVSPVKF